MSQFSNTLWIFFTGCCIGAADLVPGISGGTMAFILGIYEAFLNALQSLKPSSLFKGRYKQFFTQIEWQFLLPLLSGISFSFLTLSHLIAYLLAHELYRSFLYSIFFGLIIASVLCLAKQIGKMQLKDLLALAAGALLAYWLTQPNLQGALPHSSSNAIFNPWLILCGALAISAMLLPGISGSYLLMILGVYPLAIGSLTIFLSELKQLSFNFEAASVLGNLFLGIVLGALLFSRVVYWLLKKFPKMTFSSLLGFMIGALKTVWPFWSFSKIPNPLGKGEALSLLNPTLPDLTSAFFWQSLACCLLGFALVMLVDSFGKKKPLFT